MATFTGDTTNPPLTITTQLIAGRLGKDEQTNELYLPLASTVVLKRKQQMLYVPLDFENNLTVDAFWGLKSPFHCNYPEGVSHHKTKSAKNYSQNRHPASFQTQVTSGELEKLVPTAPLKFESGDNIFAEHFVVMGKLTTPILGLHFERNNSVVIDTTHGLIHLPHLTMQVKTASNETIAQLQPVITEDAIMITPSTTKTNTAFVDHLSKCNTKRNVTPLQKITQKQQVC